VDFSATAEAVIEGWCFDWETKGDPSSLRSFGMTTKGKSELPVRRSAAMEFFCARSSDKSVESAWALLFVFSEIGGFPFVLVCRVNFCVFATFFGTDSSLFSSSENYFSTGEVTCKDQDRVVKAAAFSTKSWIGRSACSIKKTDP
jgi:hypothetical protein